MVAENNSLKEKLFNQEEILKSLRKNCEDIDSAKAQLKTKIVDLKASEENREWLSVQLKSKESENHEVQLSI